MRFKFSFIVLTCVAALGLSACGGGGSDSGTPSVAVANPATLVVTDSVIGTGAVASGGHKVTVKYTGWLYSDVAVDHKGTQFDAGTISFMLGSGAVIAGWDQGLPGMKVGGKRSLSIPASLAYGSGGRGSIPPNAGLQFDVELITVE